MPSHDPLMAVVDRLPLVRPDLDEPPAGEVDSGVRLFGLRFAVDPITPSDGKHKKTYYTVTVQEATLISKDGIVVTQMDDVQKERED